MVHTLSRVFRVKGLFLGGYGFSYKEHDLTRSNHKTKATDIAFHLMEPLKQTHFVWHHQVLVPIPKVQTRNLKSYIRSLFVP